MHINHISVSLLIFNMLCQTMAAHVTFMSASLYAIHTMYVNVVRSKFELAIHHNLTKFRVESECLVR